MKQVTQYIKHTLLLGAVVLMGSCKQSFLEVAPKGSLIAEKTNDYYLLYNNLASSTPTDLMQYMGDDIVHLDPFYSSASNQIKRSFDWEDDIFTEDENPSALGIHLDKLYTMNKIIAEVMDSKGGSSAEKKSILAEARVARAVIHFTLVNTYGKSYREATAATDLGFPILTQANLTQNHFERATVKEVYDFIIKEIKESIDDLPTMVTNRGRMTKGAANGYLGKVYVFMGRHADAVPYLEAAMTQLSNASIPLHLIDYNTAFDPGGIYAISFFGPTEIMMQDNPETINLYPHNVGGQSYFLAPTYYVSPATLSEFGATDKRLNFYIDRNFSPATPFPGNLKRSYTRSSSNHFGISIPDLYLLLAESYARTDALTDARSTLQTFREHRMATADAAISSSMSKNDVIKLVIQERKKEYLGMGDRFQVIRRLHGDSLFPEFSSVKHQVFKNDGTLLKEISMPEERLTMRLPLKTILQNPNMEQNP
jgi:hypothetical protein